MIIEGEAKIYLPNQTSKISKEQKVFYNPAMRLNRDITVLILNSLQNKRKLKSFALPMAASAIRAVRIEKEIEGLDKNSLIYANDLSPDACRIIKANKDLNNCNFTISNKDANLFMLDSTGFDYIDIDPFGSPNPFLNSALTRISRNGILAVTATDTAPLCGTYPKTCLRNYWAKPIRNELMHEIGLKILIRKIQLIGAQFDKALIPIFSYYKDHYFRIFFEISKSKTKADEILKQHKNLIYNNITGEHKIIDSNQANIKNKNYDDLFFVSDDKKKLQNNLFFAGPFYDGKIFDENLVSDILESLQKEEMKKNISKETQDLIYLIDSEKTLSDKILYNLHAIGKKTKIRLGKTNDILEKIKQMGHNATKTHFNKFSIKTDMNYLQLLNVLKS